MKVLLNNDDLESLRPNGEVPDNGEEITGYFRRDTLAKVVDWVGLSHCIKTYEFYIYNGKPVFVFVNQADYNYNTKTGAMDYAHKTDVFEGRYYFNKGIIIQKIEKGNYIPQKGEILEMLRAHIPKYSKILLKEYRKRKLR